MSERYVASVICKLDALCRIFNIRLKKVFLTVFPNFVITLYREVHYKQMHPNEPLYPCLECGAKFMTKSGRWSHSFSHRADDHIKCEHCSKTFNVSQKQ
jgi:DNA-directed RNA polymerase subunit RPC12/RpoP